MSNHIVFYHANCTDGFGAAFSAWQMLRDDGKYIPVNYGEVKNLDDVVRLAGQEIDANTVVYILDFSFPMTVFNALVGVCGSVIWLDHHKSAFDMLGIADMSQPYVERDDNHFVVLDSSRSGAMIAWDFFADDMYTPLLIQHIDDRDRWQFQIPGTKAVNAALRLMQPWSFEQWDRLAHDMDRSIDYYQSMILRGDGLITAQEQAVEQSAKNAREVTILGRTGLAVNTDQNMSEVGHVLATKSGTFGLVWYVGTDGSAKCSLRSNGDYDVTEIARNWGGGGHKNASGMQVSVLNVLSWLKVEG